MTRNEPFQNARTATARLAECHRAGLRKARRHERLAESIIVLPAKSVIYLRAENAPWTAQENMVTGLDSGRNICGGEFECWGGKKHQWVSAGRKIPPDIV